MHGVAVAALLVSATLAAPQDSRGPAASLPRIDTTALPREAARAIDAAYAAATHQPQNADLVARLAMVLHAWEEWDHATAVYRVAHNLAPRDYRWWHLAGLLETRRGRHVEAVQMFGRAAQLAPSEPAVQLRLAEAQLETGDLDGSEPAFKKLTGHAATAAAAEYGLGRVAMARRDPTTALQHFEKALAAFPEFGAAHYGRALAYRRLGRGADADAALAQQQQCLACWPPTGDTLAAALAAIREDAGAVLQRGLALARDGQDGPAIEAHERALSLDPALTQARVNLITLYGRTGNWSRAEEEYRQALKSGTNVAEAHANYGQVLLAERRAADAVPIFRSALSINPADAQAWNGLGLALETTGDLEGATAAYREALLNAPAVRSIRFNYARVLVGAGRLSEAIAELEKLRLPEDVETARYRFALAAALVRAGQVDRGRAEAVTALQLARRYHQNELAATIERDLALLR
jgi:tetratricopeptide (TPR) repeat protein